MTVGGLLKMNKQKKDASRIRHHYLDNGAILTVITCLNYVKRDVQIGWSVFNPTDKVWKKKMGNHIANFRMENYPLSFVLTESEPILSDYISLRALHVILSSSLKEKFTFDYDTKEYPDIIPKKTLESIMRECDRISLAFANRLGLGYA